MSVGPREGNKTQSCFHLQVFSLLVRMRSLRFPRGPSLLGLPAKPTSCRVRPNATVLAPMEPLPFFSIFPCFHPGGACPGNTQKGGPISCFLDFVPFPLFPLPSISDTASLAFSAIRSLESIYTLVGHLSLASFPPFKSSHRTSSEKVAVFTRKPTQQP